MGTKAFVLILLIANGVAQAQITEKVPVPPLPKLEKDDPREYGNQLANYADLYDSGWRDEVLKGRMTLFAASGDSVVRSFARMTYESRDRRKGNKIVVKFLQPAEIAGVAALTFENPGSSDDSWLWLPSSKRTRRISGANNTASFQGTEFTYEDLGDVDPTEYDWRFLEETTLKRGSESIPVYKLRARPTYRDTGYSSLVVYINKEHWRHERIEYYDKTQRRLKSRDSSEWQLFHGRFWRAKRVEMTNHLTGKRTLLEIQTHQVSLHRYKNPRTGRARPNLTEELFTTRSLGR